MLPHPSPGSGLVANSPLNPMHVPSPAGLMPTSSPGPCSNVQVGHSPAGSFMQTGTYSIYHIKNNINCTNINNSIVSSLILRIKK